MDDPTSLLFGLESFRVVDVVRVADRVVQVVVETADRQGICPECGTASRRVKQRPLVRIRDLPVADQQVALWWRKRRLACLEPSCPRGSFTQVSSEVPPRSRLTARLRQRLAEAIAGSNRAVSEVAAEYGVSWRTAHRALVAAAARWLGPPTPTRVLGIDETRARTVRWVLAEQGWRRSDPWMTSFVDADTTGPGLLLGLAPGRSGACVRTWLAEQTPQFRAGIELVVIDPSAPYASGIRAALPRARIAVDHWHLVRLANDVVTEVRQRVTRQLHQRRGLVCDPGTALWRFYDACAQADMPETTRLAQTIETWWPAILTVLTERVTNARTEGFNRIIKQVKRVACGFRNMDNYRRRIMTHIAVTRPRLQTA